MQVLNATAIASGYAGRDPQGETSDESFCKFSFVHKKQLKSSSFSSLKEQKNKLSYPYVSLMAYDDGQSFL